MLNPNAINIKGKSQGRDGVKLRDHGSSRINWGLRFEESDESLLAMNGKAEPHRDQNQLQEPGERRDETS